MTYTDEFNAWVARTGVHVGSEVRALRGWSIYDSGLNPHSITQGYAPIDEWVTVEELSPTGVWTRDSRNRARWVYPFGVLEVRREESSEYREAYTRLCEEATAWAAKNAGRVTVEGHLVSDMTSGPFVLLKDADGGNIWAKPEIIKLAPRYVVAANFFDRNSNLRWLMKDGKLDYTPCRSLVAKDVKFDRSSDYEEGFGCRIVALAEEVETSNSRKPAGVRLRFDEDRFVDESGKVYTELKQLTLCQNGAIYGVAV